MHHVAPYNAYPTPPPPSFSSSSSSLANALGTPPKKKDKYNKIREQVESPPGPKPSESTVFFNDFLRDKLPKAEKASSVASKTSPPSTPTMRPSSPDPLRMGNGKSSPFSTLSSSHTTPKKRKIVEILIETPSKKTCAPTKYNKPASSEFSTPRTHVQFTPLKTENSAAPISSFAKKQVYVEMKTPPSKQYTTPQRPRLHQPSSSSLGGYGSEEDTDRSRRKEITSGARLTGKKTGDRDDRGDSGFSFVKIINH